jgi:DNA/RNA endonuclease YhcR with UshA esterase domain
MLGRQERTALLLLVVTACIVIAAHGALTLLGKEPFARPFSPSVPDGELVHGEGTIAEAGFTKTGGHVNLKVGNVTVFVPAASAKGLSFTKGQNVSFYGIVETYRGEKEIVIQSADDIRFLD